MAISRILGPDGRPIELDVLSEEIAAPSLTGIRQVWHSTVASHLTPQRLANILENAAQGDAYEYLTLAEEMEERDMHYASVLGTRKLSLVGLDVRVEAVTDSAEDVRRADAVRALAGSAEFGEMAAHLVDALGKGYAVSEIVWDRSGREWWPGFEERDPRFFRFDQDTGRELRLLDETDPANGLPLPAFKFVVHRPRIRSGLPIRGGLARLAAPAYMCKAWTWRDWMAFADIYGLPMRVGQYGPNATKDDIGKLMAAVANLGSDAAAVMPESVRIQFEQAASVAGAGEFFDKLAAFWDKQISKGVLGQTMTADDGASLSQAQVHQTVRLDIMTADARALSNTLQRQLVEPFCALNFGPGDAPHLTVVVPKPDNTSALVDALQKLVPFGLSVEQSVIRDKLGLPDPDADSDVLRPPLMPTQPAFNRALNAEAAPIPRPAPMPITAYADGDAVTVGVDALSRLASPLIGAWVDELRAGIESAGSLETARDGLLDRYAALSVTSLARHLAQALAVMELAGRAQVRDWVASSAGGEDGALALNVEQAGGGVLNRGWQPAAEFFMQKVNLPTARWDDLWQGQHARAFVVAGATRDALLTDLRRAVEDAIVHGGSYDSFKADFEDIVARHGWTGWTGEETEAGRDWRARTIWQTNLSTAHAAGRYQQMTDPDTLAHMPYWQYRHNSITNPREEHVGWDGLVLRWDDPWWQTHYPPNGWNCRCDVRPVSERMLRNMGKDGPDSAPPPGKGDPPPEWAYNVGEAAWGKPVAEKAMDEWRAKKGDAWEAMTPGDAASYGLPAELPLDAMPVALGSRAYSPEELHGIVERVIGGEQKVYSLPARGGGTLPILLDAKTFAGHVDPQRAAHIELLDAVLSDPQEAWLSFEQHKGTGAVVLRLRLLRAFVTGDKKTHQVVAISARNGVLEGWTFVPGEKRYGRSQRRGKLIWSRGDGL